MEKPNNSELERVLKIAIVTPFYPSPSGEDPGGIGNHFHHLAQGFLGEGHKVEVFQFPYTGEFQGTLEVEGVPVHRYGVSRPNWFSIRGFGRLARITGFCDSYPSRGLFHLSKKVLQRDIEARGFEVVEATSNRGLPYSYCRSRGNRLPVITRVSTSMAHHFRENQQCPDVNQANEAWFEKELIRMSNALVTHTRAHAVELEEELGIPANRFEIIPHGIGLPGTGELPAPVTDSAGTVTILYVGRFEERKGTDVLLAAIPKVLAECPDVKFQLAGRDPGGKWEEGFRAGNSSEVQQKVRFLGRVDDDERTRLYKACDIFVAPSRYESFGLVYAEAMGYGKPVIGCKAGGVPEVIGNEAGLLAGPGDAISLAGCIVRLAKDPGARAKMGQAGRQRVVSLFSREKMTRDTLALYRRVLSDMAPTGRN
jgi:glycosyltransferase involved in cell wall biosynthesis